MNKQKYQLQLTPEQTLAHLTTIAAGLLASGHFIGEYETKDGRSDYRLVPNQQRQVITIATSVLSALMENIEGEINEGDASHYIDAGDPRRHFLPGSDNERRKAWLKNPVARQPDSTED